MLQTDLFHDEKHLPHRPYCTDDLYDGLRIRSLDDALKKAYIQINPHHLRVWSIYDIDREGGALVWEHADLPPPAWSAINRDNGHAHLVWGLSVPVLVNSPDMRQKPLRYLCAVEEAFRAKLQADSGYSGLITKNPQHPLWQLMRGPQVGYDLDYLSEFVDLPKYTPKRKPEQVGLGRNVTLFDYLRGWAYSNIKRVFRDGYRYDAWVSVCNTKALERNGDFNTPMDGREVWQIAKSVAKFVWHRFNIADSDAKFSKLQSHRGSKGGKKNTPDMQSAKGQLSGISRLQASEDKRSSARLMQSQGLTQREIAEALGVTRQTVNGWLKTASVK